MRLCILVLAVLFSVFCTVGVNGVSASSLTINDIPTCGLQCLFLTVPAAGCALDDFDCQCSSSTLARTASACMLANCTMEESLVTSKVQASICQLPEESKRSEVLVYTGVIFAIAVIFVTLRIIAKAVTKGITIDDWFIVVSMLLTAVPCGCVLTMTRLGFGEHLWKLQSGHLLKILQLFYISWSTYVLILGLLKVSLVMFYLQIFGSSRKFCIAAYTILGLIVANTLAIYLPTIFACRPVKAFWDRDVKGQCIDVNALAYANSACAIAQDVILLVLPLAMVRKLQMKRNRKIAVSLMFTIGTFGCIATIIRLRSLLNFKISVDPTWDYVPVTVWTEIELACVFVCVSLPSIKQLLSLVMPNNIFTSISHRTTSQYHGQRKPQENMKSGPSVERKVYSRMRSPLSFLDTGKSTYSEIDSQATNTSYTSRVELTALPPVIKKGDRYEP